MEILASTAERIALGRRGRPASDKWDKWFRGGQTVRLTRGEDFTCRPQSIRQQAYNKAKERGGQVSVSVGVHPESGAEIVELTFQAGTPDDSDTLWPQSPEAAQSPST